MNTSRLAVLMVADVVGYSQLMANDERAAIAVVQKINANYLGASTAQFGGEVLKRMGDGWIIAFNSVSAAIDCATMVLQEMASFKEAQIRIGSHIGEIIEDGEDFYGAGVNLAARLQSEAPPGGLMISADLFRQLTGESAGKFQSAGEFNLKNIPYPVEGFQWRPARAGIENRQRVPSIRVEPFRSAPMDPDTEGMTGDLREQLLMSLATRTGVRTLDATQTNEPNPTYVLNATLRRSGDQARLTISLALCETGLNQFTRNYQGDVSNFFAFIDDTVARVNSDIRIQINAYDDERLAHRKDEELSVSELRSRASKSFYRGNYSDWDYSRQLMERALRLSPTDPMALAMHALSLIYLAAARHQPFTSDEAAKIEEELLVSFQGNPRSDFALQTRAMFRAYHERDGAACIRDAEKSLAITPDYQVALLSKGLGHTLMGEFEKSIAVLTRATIVAPDNPLKVLVLFPLAVSYFCTGRYSEAAVTLEEAIDLRPTFWALYKLRGATLAAAGQAKQAEVCFEKAASLPRRPEVMTMMPLLPTEHDELVELLKPDIGSLSHNYAPEQKDSRL